MHSDPAFERQASPFFSETKWSSDAIMKLFCSSACGGCCAAFPFTLARCFDHGMLVLFDLVKYIPL